MLQQQDNPHRVRKTTAVVVQYQLDEIMMTPAFGKGNSPASAFGERKEKKIWSLSVVADAFVFVPARIPESELTSCVKITGKCPSQFSNLQESIAFKLQRPFSVASEFTVLVDTNNDELDEYSYKEFMESKTKFQLDLRILFKVYIYIGKGTPVKFTLLSFGEPVEPEEGKKRKQGTPKPLIIPLYSDKGFDEAFRTFAGRSFETVEENPAQYHFYYYIAKSRTCQSFKNSNLLHNQHAVAFVAPYGYSSFAMDKIKDLIEIDRYGKDTVRAVKDYSSAVGNENNLFSNEAIFQNWNMKEICKYCLIYLEMIRTHIGKGSETNRRFAINAFLLIVACLTDLSIEAEYSFSTTDFGDELRMGTGPLDYYLTYQPTQAPSVSGDVESSELFAPRLLRDLLFKVPTDSSVKQQIPLVVSFPADDEIDEEDRISTEEFGNELLKSSGFELGVVEAKKNALTKMEVNKGLGQLVAQMMDALKVLRTKNPQPSNPLLVKGILTTGQHSLFFSLEDRAKSPFLRFFGRFSVWIFENEQEARDSGLEKGENLSAEEVEKFLKNLYCFLAL